MNYAVPPQPKRQAKSRLTQAELDTIATMRERGLSYAQIGRSVGMSPSAVSWHCLRLGVDPPKPSPLRPHYHLLCSEVRRGNHVVRAFTPDEDARLVELAKRGLSNTAIAREIGRKWNSVAGRLMTLARREERGFA